MSISQADRLRIQIEDEILAAHFKPGDRLDECKLAERYGTSRTPVREALRQLSSNGLVEIRPHRGAIVAKMGVQEVIEIFEVLAELEGACARLAAKSGLKSDLDGIRSALDACRIAAEAGDLPGYQAANERFHLAIYDASRNVYMTRITINARNRVAAFRRLQLEQLNRLPKSYTEHKGIFEAIEQGMPDDADRLMQEHTLHRGNDIRRFISVLPAERVTNGGSLYDAVAAK
jgi:DNA-binding GntR family transcriptional regulator